MNKQEAALLTEQNLVVVQDNDLVSACYKLNLNAKRLLILAISKLDSMSDDWKYAPQALRIERDDWCNAYDIDIRNGVKTLREAADALYTANVRIGSFRKGAEFRFVSRHEWDNERGCVSITFTQELLKFATGIWTDFTKYTLLTVKEMKSSYAIRMYELAAQYAKIGKRTIELQDLRAMLGVEDGQYEKFGDFNKWVLKRAVEEASLKGNYDIDMLSIRRGRKVVAVTLFIRQKTQTQFVFE